MEAEKFLFLLSNTVIIGGYIPQDESKQLKNKKEPSITVPVTLYSVPVISRVDDFRRKNYSEEVRNFRN